MSTRTYPLFAGLLAVLLCAAPLVAQKQPAEKKVDSADRDRQARIQEMAREVAREVEYTQEDIITELAARKERTLYTQAESVLVELDRLQKVIREGATSDQMARAFDEFDGKLHAFLDSIAALPAEQRLLHRDANRISAADERLHSALFEKDASKDRGRKVLERQARALASVALQLQRAAEYALADFKGNAVLLGDLKKLSAAAEQFQKGLRAEKRPEELRKDFSAVSDSWTAAVRGLRGLAPGENIHLLRLADQADRIFGRVYHLLGMEGDRPQLIIRT